MNRNLIVASLVAAAFGLAVPSAMAQERHEHAREHGNGGAAQSAPAPRQEAQPQAVPRQAPRADTGQYRGRAVPRAEARPQYQPPAYRPEARGGYAVPRTQPYYSGRYVRPYNYAPYRPYYFPRPYYSFRPHRTIGFGLWLGYPVPYPYAYLGGYSPRVYGYYPGGPYSVSVYGGVSFDIRPFDADVFVDGQYAGRTGDFTPGAAPLTLTPGVHHVAVQRDGFEPMEWDVTVQPGQVIPYRGDMRAY